MAAPAIRSAGPFGIGPMNGPWVTMNVAQSMGCSVVPLATTPPIAIASGWLAWAARIRSIQSGAGCAVVLGHGDDLAPTGAVPDRPHLEDRLAGPRDPDDVRPDIVDSGRRTTAAVHDDDLATDPSDLITERVDRPTSLGPPDDGSDQDRDAWAGSHHGSDSFCGVACRYDAVVDPSLAHR